jgi:hypothetical protein
LKKKKLFRISDGFLEKTKRLLRARRIFIVAEEEEIYWLLPQSVLSTMCLLRKFLEIF